MSIQAEGSSQKVENQLFRQKSLDHISSPEQLHDYMRVTSPRLWMILAAIVILLAGFIVYASTANMESTMDIRVSVENFDMGKEEQTEDEAQKVSYIYSMMPLSMQDTVKVGMEVRIGSGTGKVSWIVTDAEADELTVMIEMEQDFTALPDGDYDAVLVLEKTTPISFLWN